MTKYTRNDLPRTGPRTGPFGGKLPASVPPAALALAAFAGRQVLKRHPVGRAAFLGLGAYKAIQAARRAGASKVPGR